MGHAGVVGQVVKYVDTESVWKKTVAEIESFDDWVSNKCSSKVNAWYLWEIIKREIYIAKSAVNKQLLYKVEKS